MRYMMLVCVDESVEVSEAEGLPTAWVEEMEARGVRQFGSRLRPVSDAAIEVASKHPAARFGTIEVRPLWEG